MTCGLADGWMDPRIFLWGTCVEVSGKKHIYTYIYIIAAWGTIYPSYLNDDHTMIMSIHH